MAADEDDGAASGLEERIRDASAAAFMTAAAISTLVRHSSRVIDAGR